MKRLLAQIGITYFSVLAVAFYLPEKATFALLAAAAVGAAVLMLIRKARRTIYLPVMALTVVIACCVNIGFTNFAVIPVQERFAGDGKRIEATLSDEVYRAYSKYYYRLTTESINGEEVSTKLLLKTAQPIDIEPCDTITFTADIHTTDNDYYLSKGYYLTVDTFSDDFCVAPAESYSIYSYAIRLRQSLREALDEYLPEDVAALCKAVFVGDKYALDADTKADFRYAGASYYVVVSGMHFSIICLLLYRLLRSRYLHLNSVVTFIIMFGVILLYMAVTGFQPSVVRSGVMMTVYMGGKSARQIGYAHSSLGIAGIVSAFVFGPYGAGDIGLILSFAATFAIITWGNPIYYRLRIKSGPRLVRRAANAVISAVSVSLAAVIAVLPISIFVFRAFSTVTLVSALLLYLPIELILILSLFLCLFFYLGPLRYFSLVLSWPLFVLSKFVLWLIGALASLPFSYVYIGHGFFYIWTGVTLLLGGAVIAFRRRLRLLPYAAVISAIFLIAGTMISAAVDFNSITLTVYQCGDGLTVAYRHQGALYMLAFDAKSGDAYRLLGTLADSSGGAELAVCSKKHDYVNYSRVSDKEFAISRYLLYDNSVKDDGTAELITYSDAEQYFIGDGAVLTVSEGGGKLMSYLTVDDVSVLVIPDKFPYRKIPEAMRRADVIVMTEARDGYEGLSCDVLIVSSSADNAPDVIERMQGRYRRIYCTCDDDVTIDLR